MKKEKIYKILTILLIMQWAFVQIIAKYPNFIEKNYSNGLYIYVSKFSRILLGWIPFSIGDILYIAIVFFILKGIFRVVKAKKLNFKKTIFRINTYT